MRNKSIKAVVLEIDCPGGEVSAVEDIYLSILNLKKSKPVVAAILTIGASGGYYIAASADYIYALPSSNVGSIGVIAFVPKKEDVDEDVIDTGRYKRTGYSEKEFPFKVQLVLDSFLDVVEMQRGEKLKLSRSELSKAMIYFGNEALVYGLVDEIGSTLDAIEKAARLAEIKDYEVVRISSKSFKRNVINLEEIKMFYPPPSFHYLYLITQENETERYKEGGFASSSGNRVVLIDYSHENAFQLDDINFLLSKIVEKGYSVRYGKENISKMLNDSKALIIISPRKDYSDGEIKAIRNFVEKGGKVLVICDPSRTNASALNSLVTDFGLIFASGYLYNMYENYGNYRNIVITQFNSSKLANVERVVLFTATFIHGGKGIAFTSNDTYFSESEIAGNYKVISSNNNVLAIGDQTFLEQPYCYIEDNHKLVSWIGDYLTS
jgi:signal peptide peptidase SppA